MGHLRNFEVGVFQRLRRDPPRGKIHRIAFWLLLAYLIFLIAQVLPGNARAFFQALAGFTLFLLVIFCIPLFWRWLMGRVLWKVRNRLVVTYLLMGLTPVVLFATLALVLLYVFSGQFAIFAANDVIELEQAHIASENRAFAISAAHTIAANPKAASITLPEFDDTDPQRPRTGIAFAAFENGQPLRLLPAVFNSGAIQHLPTWVQNSFSGLVEDRGALFLRAVDTETVDKTSITTVTSLPLQKENVEQIARGLGAVTIIPDVNLRNQKATEPRTRVTFSRHSINAPVGVKINGQDVNPSNPTGRIRAITGGSIPPPLHFYDLLVTFIAPLDTHNWQTGKTLPTFTRVDSRPTALYKRLFITSLNTVPIWRDVFIGLAIAFGLLEMFAFFLAVRLNLTITGSVRDLYQATEAIDQGNLTHRIQVKRNDQLAALSHSFNNMTASLARLLEEQREKQRMQSELAIAQEVQANLFPRSTVSLPLLELHGACYPARTVSGDYYDFLLSGANSLGLAIGDISGKGISAALLMATLHSAVRAFRFAGEEMTSEGAAAAAKAYTRLEGEQVVLLGKQIDDPGRMLALLNHHLYRSTQPEKYATLFLAHYDGDSRRIVYSNGGQLPPFLLRADDSVVRLDRGGTVVGLIDNMTYEQGAEHLHPGDILIAYSDGVTEPENEFGEFGEERLIEVVRRHRHLPLEAISEQVMQSLRSWIGGQEQPDDITLVLARQL
ncbi:MAG TPA: SpoIIE family protein phosphatase [Acidobacteriaceae bacterium]|nr:SpoIIE family protein phosphatase [Acidobacteriaceae bacterium]